jgi:hypothetical protein
VPPETSKPGERHEREPPNQRLLILTSPPFNRGIRRAALGLLPLITPSRKAVRPGVLIIPAPWARVPPAPPTSVVALPRPPNCNHDEPGQQHNGADDEQSQSPIGGRCRRRI